MFDPTCCHEPDYQVWRGRNVCMSCGVEERVVKKDTPREHDRLCLAPNPQLILPEICTYCQLIRKVRAEYELSDVEGHPV